MSRAVLVLLVLATALRAAALGGLTPVPGTTTALAWVAAGVGVLVLALATATHVARLPGAAAAIVALGSLGAAGLMATGLGGVDDLELWDWLRVAADGVTALAGATVVARWQDVGAPAAGPGRRPLRALALTAGMVVALSMVTAQVLLLGSEAGRTGMALATTVTPARVPLLAAVLAPLAWAATRADARPLRAVALVVAGEAVAGAARAWTLHELGAAWWPAAVLGAAALLLGVAVPLRVRQVSSSSA